MILHGCIYSVRAWTVLVKRQPRQWARRSCKSSPAKLFLSSKTANSHDNDTASANNNPKLWKGASYSSSEFVTHVIAGPDEPTVLQAIHSAIFKDKEALNEEDSIDVTPKDSSVQLSAAQLLRMGSIWFLPSDAPRNPSMGMKPVRLSKTDSTKLLKEGDYLRIHHSPRRFPAVYNYSWNTTYTTNDDCKPNVIVAQDTNKGYLVIDKPAGVPVHPTVDNVLENVAESIRAAMPNTTTTPYVSTTQRLDQNTSGLLVVSTKKAFAAYHAKLLRKKTDQQLNATQNNDQILGSSAIHKQYKCLVCLMPPTTKNAGDHDQKAESEQQWSVSSEMDRLRSYETNSTVMRHYLEPSIRAPKNFERVPGNESWAECLLRIVGVGDAFPLVGSNAANELANELWNKNKNAAETMPSNCLAVVELEVELLTGRTHQIRGQLSTEGFPLVGDAQYGGACIENEGRPGHPPISATTSYINSNQLALQCCQLEFLDPNIVENEDDGTETMVRSDRWKIFRLEEAWWTPLLSRYQQQASNDEATMGAADEEQLKALKERRSLQQQGEPQHNGTKEWSKKLPPRVMLSPGVHKYVIIKAKNRHTYESHVFVKSAAPSECGGVYHANVAQDLVQDLETSGFYDEVVVTGGGRIDYDENIPHAHVFGFSYGFGKGNHELAASVIERESNNTVIATFDNSNGLY